MSKIVNLKSVRKHWYHLETPQLIFKQAIVTGYTIQTSYTDGLHYPNKLYWRATQSKQAIVTSYTIQTSYIDGLHNPNKLYWRATQSKQAIVTGYTIQTSYSDVFKNLVIYFKISFHLISNILIYFEITSIACLQI